MKVTLTGLAALFFFTPLSFAQEGWEVCLDKGDFLFIANSFTKSHRISKTDCRMRFVEIGGKGKKFEINLCDPQIHIDEFATIDATSYIRHYAGSAGCPAPLFGADFDLEKGQKGAVGYKEARTRMLEMQAAVKIAIAPKSSPRDVEKVKNAGILESEAKMACMQLLAGDYLERCIAFEARTKDSAPPPTPAPVPGIHQQTIQK